ncbi:MAG: hypothetical protein KGZ65_04475 [Sphingomonadales bacterium]|nr:hypothetical protein [Sphingomonadaceae bacterium]MBS3930470.1 hypothetical protein [Sphingomonadales bacterium]
MKSNAAPTLRALDEAPAWCLGQLSESEVVSRVQDVLSDSAFVDRLLAAYEQTKTEYEDSEHVEQQIYNGFPTPPDEVLMERFHVTPWQDRHLLIPQFADQRLSFLAARVIYAEHPNHLPDELRHSVQTHIRSRVHFEDECKWGTVSKALAECDDKLSSATGEQARLLERYKAHLLATYS